MIIIEKAIGSEPHEITIQKNMGFDPCGSIIQKPELVWFLSSENWPTSNRASVTAMCVLLLSAKKPFSWRNPSGPEGFRETLQVLKGSGKPFRS